MCRHRGQILYGKPPFLLATFSYPPDSSASKSVTSGGCRAPQHTTLPFTARVGRPEAPAMACNRCIWEEFIMQDCTFQVQVQFCEVSPKQCRPAQTLLCRYTQSCLLCNTVQKMFCAEPQTILGVQICVCELCADLHAHILLQVHCIPSAPIPTLCPPSTDFDCPKKLCAALHGSANICTGLCA
jgi:hypothetical protein